MDPIALLVFAAIIVEIIAIPSYAEHVRHSLAEEEASAPSRETERP